MDRKRFKKQVAFILEADKEKNILRQTHLSGHGRRENDAEHAWHMAMMIYLLKEYANAEFDLAKTMMMALIHDIVEIDAGDTYAYDTAGLATQAEREEKAAERIFGLLPDDQRDELRGLFEEFDDGVEWFVEIPGISGASIKDCSIAAISSLNPFCNLKENVGKNLSISNL